MSMSTHVIGIVPPDAEWQRMKTAWDSLQAVNLEPPKELYEFFGLDPGTIQQPDSSGVLVAIPSLEFSDSGKSGIEVELSKVPGKVKIVRFYNSW